MTHMNVSLQAKWLIFITLLINAAAMLSPVINGGDSVTYATLSQHIALNNDWMNLVLDGQDWLDKPHMPFWITALFFKIGGISAFTYTLPGFLFHLIGGYFTYRIARLFYGRETAWLSLLVYVSVFHLMDSSIEVKAETYLTGFIMGACYYWLRYDAATNPDTKTPFALSLSKGHSWFDRLTTNGFRNGVPGLKYLLLGALFSAGAVMTKGVFTLITISSGLVCLWLYRRQWDKLWSSKWLLALFLTLLFTAPEVIALYLQFDAHPEMVVFGQTNVSGIKFFLWDSQFGRFFNTGPIKNTQGNPAYFVLVFLWAFLPWVAVFVAAIFSGVRKFVARTADERAGFVFLCGAFFITFVMFSATSFQLDHYTVILFPFAAIICGKYLNDWLAQSAGRALFIAQLAMTALLVGLALSLSVYVGKPLVLAVVLALFGALLVYGYVTRKEMRTAAVLVYPVFGIAMLYAFLVLTAASMFASCSIAHNANAQLAGKVQAPVYVYQMDVIVARELGLYSGMPSYSVEDAAQLPTSGRYFLLVRNEQLAQLSERLGHFEQVGQGNWVVHKTGTFPRFLRLAKGEEPLEDIRIVQVYGMR